MLTDIRVLALIPAPLLGLHLEDLAQGSATQNVERAILDQKNKKQICLEPQKNKSLMEALY